MADRAPVNGPPFGTVTWAEHETVWRGYAADYGNQQSAERIAERGGFGLSEMVTYLGAMPTTWEADSRTRRPRRARTSHSLPPGESS